MNGTRLIAGAAVIAVTIGLAAPALANPVQVSPATRSTIIKDASGPNRPPSQCYEVWTSTADRRWALIDESKYAINNPQYCTLSDAWSYARRTPTGWQFLDYAGSSVDECPWSRRGLRSEGMPLAVITDFKKVRGCAPAGSTGG